MVSVFNWIGEINDIFVLKLGCGVMLLIYVWLEYLCEFCFFDFFCFCYVY